MINSGLKSIHSLKVKKVTILGSTGSIGQSTLKVIESHPNKFQVQALCAGSNVELLIEQALKFRPRVAVISDSSKFPILKDALKNSGIEPASGDMSVIGAARLPADVVVAAIVGAAGLSSAIAAAKQGSIIALANKEALVCAGNLLMSEVERSGAKILPIDSEHNAIYQIFDFENPSNVEKITLTASGGPFREYSTEQMRNVTPAQAINHPKWTMGAKISVDSATMMNKGLEYIEAYHLFPISRDKIEILVHPESIIHGMVSYKDGSVKAVMGNPNMTTPIAFALAWPERVDMPDSKLDLCKLGTLSFNYPDEDRFPALMLAREALSMGENMATVLNAANEVAVAAFLNEEIAFLDIARTVEETMTLFTGHTLVSIEEVIMTDKEARIKAKEVIKALSSNTTMAMKAV